MRTNCQFEIDVLKTGLFTSVQSAANYSFLDKGVPTAGPMDSFSAQQANKIVGNPKNAEVIEITLIGPEFRFKGDCIIGLCGADITPKLNGENISNNCPISVKKGDVLSFGKCNSAMRTYLAIAGNIEKENTYLTERIERGSSIRVKADNNTETSKVQGFEISKSIPLEKGPETKYLQKKQFDSLFNRSFKLASDSNRMASIIENVDISGSGEEMISSGVIPGTIQLLPSGKLAILMRDCQTMGGYPRIGVVPEKGLNSLAQLKPGEKFVFVE